MSPDERTLLEFVSSTLVKRRDVEVTEDTLLFEDRLIDSMNILNLIGYVEKRLGRRLRDDEIVMSNFASVRAIAEAFLS